MNFGWLLFIQTIWALPILQNTDIWDDSHNQNAEIDRLPRVLNFFPVPVEEECLSKDGRRVCMNPYECRIQSGTSQGQCALGFGVCCVFTATCGQEVFNNITHFTNPDFPDLSTGMTNCSLVIKKIDPEIVQLRFDFIHFNLGQPNRRTGVCEEDIFVLNSNFNELILCGLNSGQHIYYDVENINEPIEIFMNLSRRAVSRLWEIRISQIPFTQRAPVGCLQYHTGFKGVIQTMNFADNGRHLANQDYNICMRQEQGMCSISYEPCHENAFKIGPNTNQSDEFEGSGDGSARQQIDCIDKIVVPCDNEDFLDLGNVGYCDLVHCGGDLCPNKAKPCRIESSAVPFTIGVHFGAISREESPEDNLGMCLNYEQLPCVV